MICLTLRKLRFGCETNSYVYGGNMRRLDKIREAAAILLDESRGMPAKERMRLVVAVRQALKQASYRSGLNVRRKRHALRFK